MIFSSFSVIIRSPHPKICILQKFTPRLLSSLTKSKETHIMAFALIIFQISSQMMSYIAVLESKCSLYIVFPILYDIVILSKIDYFSFPSELLLVLPFSSLTFPNQNFRHSGTIFSAAGIFDSGLKN